MPVDRLLRLLMGLLVVLGAVLLGIGQRNLTLPVLMVLAVATSLIFTDYLGWFRLHRAVANLAAVVAVIYSLSDFWRSDTQRQLLAIAHLLVYLQVVLLFQKKSDRIYWQLAVLSLLQVVVAAALNVGFEFGVILVVFAGAAFAALSVFFVHRVCSPFEREDSPEAGQAAAEAGSLQLAGAGRAGNGDRGEVRGPADRQERRLLLGTGVRAEPQASAQALSGELLGWGFLRHILGMGLVTLMFTTVFFYCTPRIVGSSWRQTHSHEQTVGFSNEVELNELGKILKSSGLVMRVRFLDPRNGAPVMVAGDPYFRGMVLSTYVSQGERSKWSNRQSPQTRPRGPLAEVPRLPGVLLQEVLLQPNGQPLLFSVSPAYGDQRRGIGTMVRVEPRSSQLFRVSEGDANLRLPYRFVIATDAFREGTQDRYRRQRLPATNRPAAERYWFDEKRQLLDDFPAAEMPELARTAQLVVSRAGENARSPLQRAMLLEGHFREPGLYRYTLDFTDVPRTPRLDPIEDFVANHRSGHCEYFASALTMMLRSQGIPARMVIGFRGGERNDLGGYLQIRQNMAHAWVEAFIDREDLPEELLEDADEDLIGAWFRLDPTPPDTSQEEVEEEASVSGTFGQALDYAQWLWSDYVLGLNPENQQRAALGPFRSFGDPVPDQPLGLAGRLRQLRELARRYGMDVTGWQLRDWFSWRAGLLAMLLSGMVLAVWRAGGLLVGKLALRRRQAVVRRERPRIRVDFYERLESILDRVGLRRPPGQTQQEFVLGSVDCLRARCDGAGPVERLGWIVDRFYAVRFAAQALDKAEIEAIEQALDGLERALDTTEAKR